MTIMLVAALLPAPASAAEAVTPVPRAGFDWEMAPRFGFDADGDGRIEIENTREYVSNRQPGTCPEVCPEPLFKVHLEATPTSADLGVVDGNVLTYEWRVAGPGGQGVYFRTRPAIDLLLREGEHQIDLRVRLRLPWATITQRARGDIGVQDLLVVAVGDSYASGEGSPEVPDPAGDPQWAGSTEAAAAAAHARAHRSTVGWPTRVALGLEDADRKSSVTFVNLASSGASIAGGLLGPQRSGEVSQFEQLERLVGDRQVDILLVQVGGNDIGFARVIAGLVDADPLLDPICYHTMVENVWASADDGAWDRGARVTFSLPFSFGCRSTGGNQHILPGLRGLAASLRKLAQRIDTLHPGRVLLVEYPDPTGGTAGGEQCVEIVGDVTSPFGFHEVDQSEQEEGVERVLGPLNEALADAAAQHGWEYVSGVAEQFGLGHGYCAPWPDYGYPQGLDEAPLLEARRLDFPSGWYRPPTRYGLPRLLNAGDVSWYRTAGQSAVLQGQERLRTPGTLHPNEQGHAAVARLVLSALARGD